MKALSGRDFKGDRMGTGAETERSSYCRARGADPIATFGALAAGLATVAAFAWMNPHIVQKEKREATMVKFMDLPDDPPPAADVPPPPAPDAPPPVPQISAPVPMVALPASPVTAPAPTPLPATPAPTNAPSVIPAVVAKGPENAGDLSAQVVFRKPIHVPLESRRAREEGIVILSLLVGMDGRVAEISIATSSGFPRLDRAAMASVEDWRWSPLVRDGKPVMVRGLVRIPFIRERGGHGRDRRGPRDRHDHDGPRSERIGDDHV